MRDFLMETKKEHLDPEEKNLLDVRQAAELLDVSHEEVWRLVREHKVLTHHVAGAFVRFKTSDIEVLKNRWRIERELFPKKERYFPHRSIVAEPDRMEKLRDFWHFNDFYIICSVVILGLIYMIVSFQ